jgi:hypothetical protein
MAAQTSAAQGALRIQKFIILTCWQSASEVRCAEAPTDKARTNASRHYLAQKERALAPMTSAAGPAANEKAYALSFTSFCGGGAPVVSVKRCSSVTRSRKSAVAVSSHGVRNAARWIEPSGPTTRRLLASRVYQGGELSGCRRSQAVGPLRPQLEEAPQAAQCSGATSGHSAKSEYPVHIDMLSSNTIPALSETSSSLLLALSLRFCICGATFASTSAFAPAFGAGAAAVAAGKREVS